MSEKLNSHEVGEDGSSNQTEWDSLKDVPMATKEVSGENEKNQYETELTSPENVLDDIKKYIVKDGRVYSKETGEEESDKDAILRIKTSQFLFNEARAFRDEDSHMLGKRFTDKGPDYYVDRALEKYGFKDEDTQFAGGKLLKELVNNGSHRQTIGANSLVGSKYDMFIGEKADFGKALLERRLKQHGLAMTNVDINIDSSTFVKNGYSAVSINVETTPLANTEKASDSTFRHPAAEQLEELEAEIAKAEQNGDEVAANGYRSALKMLIERNPLEVSPEDWDKMSDADKERFYKLKMKESKILGDKDSFNFWNANFKNHNQ